MRCTACGAMSPPNAPSCVRCGAWLLQSVPAAPPPPAAPSPAAPRAARATQALTGVARAATMVPGAWQTVVGSQTPDLRAFLAQAGTPLAQGAARAALRRSVRRPGIALAVTTVLDLVIVAVTGGSLGAALPRTLSGLVSSGLAMATGRKGGALRALSGATSLVTTLLGLVTAISALRSGLDSGTTLLTLAPSIIGTASMVTMAVKTAVVAFRRPPVGGGR